MNYFFENQLPLQVPALALSVATAQQTTSAPNVETQLVAAAVRQIPASSALSVPRNSIWLDVAMQLMSRPPAHASSVLHALLEAQGFLVVCYLPACAGRRSKLAMPLSCLGPPPPSPST